MSITVETYDTVGEAALAMHERSQFLGGGTMLVRGVNFGEQEYDNIVRSTDADLHDIRADGNGVRIGACVTMTQLMKARSTDFLAPVAHSIGGPAVRNMGTVGGNLFVRTPFGDLGVALLALDATVQLADGQSLPIETFFDQRASLRSLVSSVHVPRPSHGAFRYRKATRTQPKGAAIVTIAAHLPGGSRVNSPRLAFGAMGPTPLRAKDAETALEGASLDAASVQRAIELCLNGLIPQDDSIASAWYRQEVAPVHLRRLLLDEEN